MPKDILGRKQAPTAQEASSLLSGLAVRLRTESEDHRGVAEDVAGELESLAESIREELEEREP